MLQSTLGCMTVEYMSAKGVSEYIGKQFGGSVKASTIATYRKQGLMPVPDAMTDRVAGWLPETIDEWWLSRPGQGARTDLP